jgi:hypothetical protein
MFSLRGKVLLTMVTDIINWINVDEEAVASVEESLGELVDNGGEVR